MNEDIKSKWVAALRSGKYKQCHGAMREGNKKDGYSYCCLGVLTDLYTKETKKAYRYNTQEQLPSKETIKWAGLPNRNPVINGERLSLWNDKLRCDFKKIAKLIEENL